tara:strand:+ start:626 stop:1003 length:378 start_codon:yes stop_codon:yes gene_type:complete
MDKNGHIKKEAILSALEKTLGVVTTAVKQVGIARSTFYQWYNDDKEFKAAVDDIANIALDYAESRLHKQIGDDNTTATIFYLKTKGKKRGYIEKQEVDHTSGGESISKIIYEVIDKDGAKFESKG